MFQYYQIVLNINNRAFTYRNICILNIQIVAEPVTLDFMHSAFNRQSEGFQNKTD